jgi:hypothetical protein
MLAHHRLAALALRHELALACARELRRPITVFDVVDAAADHVDRARRIALVTQLREPPECGVSRERGRSS